MFNAPTEAAIRAVWKMSSACPTLNVNSETLSNEKRPISTCPDWQSLSTTPS